ncbi:unnamed protein product [Prunus armeniaca]
MPEIAWLPLALVGNRLEYRKLSSEIASTELSLLTKCKVISPPGSSLFIGRGFATVHLEKPNGALMRRAPSLLPPRVAHPMGGLTAREARKSKRSDVPSSVHSTRPSDFANSSL